MSALFKVNLELIKNAKPYCDQEIDRLISRHYILRYALGLLSTPIRDLIEENNLNVFDCGCGPATWLLELATNYRHCSFTGIDISPVFPQTIKPQNLTIDLHDALKGLPFDNFFDVVHQSFWVTVLSKDEWNFLVRELVRILKPGGYIELIELNISVNNSGQVTRYLNNALTAYYKSKKINTIVIDELEDYLEDTLKVEIYEKEVKMIPIGWNGPVGELALYDLISGYEIAKPYLSEFMGILPNQYDHLVELARKEVVARKSTFSIYRYVARKCDFF
ncbi:7892_t:CDS:2 [Ambispora gerdemannii]|uniref:7892_t:CDS:1 n=1 Tax=Ambispora gerdemannii TaxID=144530 RepID=A0A9N9FII3_9GLOM|nr:7892_t:CDS:2 [Ambispora gerdemannii]